MTKRTKRTPPYSPEVRERAVRMVFDHRNEYASQYEAILSIAAKIGCSRETLRHWVRQAERDQGLRRGPTSQEQERIKALEREVRERAVRMVFEHRAEHTSQWAAIASIAAKIGCTAQTLSNWVRQAERDQGKRAGSTTDERERIKALERENRELRQANEILRKASAYFAQAELDRRWKP